MPQITLPDGSTRQFDAPVSVHDVAASIGPGLAKAALAGRVDGELVDTSYRIDRDVELAIVTSKDEETALELIRHDAAHVMAQAVQELYPGTQVTIGPAIENGFYYDFARDEPFTPDDLERIEARMHEIVKRNLPIVREELSREEAKRVFAELGEHYKVEIIDAIPEGETITLYRQGDWFDVCRGPHLPSTGKLGNGFKLTKLAGAYWRGDAANAMLQRIYGTAWRDKKELKAYLRRLEEAEKRDHRKLGKQLDLFHFQDEAPGMAFWHAKGRVVYRLAEQYMREKLEEYGYQEVETPQVLDRSLWERSGHWEKFAESMFTTQLDDRDFAIKPMNCPGHIQLYNQGLKSYRDLPLRMAEFGVVHRNEPSGTLHGLMRARRFTQDDAHVFCTEEQLQPEVATLIDMVFETYRDFGFDNIELALSLRPEKRVGSDELWDKAEAALKHSLDAKGLEYRVQPGEGAFYGPKIEFTLHDSIGRAWQCGTIQVDFSMPGRLGAHYIAEDNSKQTPVMIHRAVLGSVERFIGILIEHYAGLLPLWLAPVQVVVLNITDRQADYVAEIAKTLRAKGLRVETDLRNEKIGFKIREHTLQRVPYLLVIGDREVETRSVAVRDRKGQDLGTLELDAFVERVGEEMTNRIA
ncbi:MULTISPECIES: threonine--tRNA ligase [Marichromatium]|uniref:Threonine--tRNA ligase n=1 Tax=Marichromatium gracile TaxID=1048 RepID=A0A4R4A8F1_MARGR|nr:MULTISPECIES: threonine--tRNA ligase [Marichromatium]MBO8087389.1 threonine--tRNA ligase [Marichromatium sp.]MBK1708034.1 threonine--tRNA ligase [Marichromatium gracile]RNE90166.1 threonine--tRNA ligase [Marichromatium sp. AB31]RNE93455.1 threonine--tRNA ligase [Marichromatium sp. AB32]TCW35161.1 threonyl-tRNA synthetase [Marichromatium gracile]